MTSLRSLVALALFTSCADGPVDLPDLPAEDELPVDDLPLGDVSADDRKADGQWGSALDCKPVPLLPPLAQPKITLSIDGLTLRLTDAASGYDRVFCAAATALSAGGSCMRQCTPGSNASECPSDMACTVTARFGTPTIAKAVCLPRP